MSSDLSALKAPRNTQKVTLSATAGDVTLVTLPKWLKTLTCTFYTSADADDVGWFEFTGTDGTAKTANAFKVASGAAYPIKMWGPRQTPSAAADIYLAADSISAYVLLHLES